MPRPHRRDWHGFDNYRQVHDGQMLRLAAEGVVVEDGLSFTERTAGGVLVSASLTGRVLTSSGAVLAVEKQLAVRYVRGRPEVRTVEYAYHAWRRGRLSATSSATTIITAASTRCTATATARTGASSPPNPSPTPTCPG